MHEVQRSYEVPFVQLPSEDLLFLMQNAKATTVTVYIALMLRANRKQGDSCFPSLKTIAGEAGVSKQTVVNAIAELETHGFVTVEHRMSPEGDATSNLYWIHRSRLDYGRGGSENGPRVVQNLDNGVVQNLDPNHMNNIEPDEDEPDVNPETKKRRASQITDEFMPNDQTMIWMSTEGFTASDLERELPRFIDYYAGKGQAMVDWQRTFKNWLRNGRDRGYRSGTNGNGGRPKPAYYDNKGGYTAEGLAAKARGEI